MAQRMYSTQERLDLALARVPPAVDLAKLEAFIRSWEGQPESVRTLTLTYFKLGANPRHNLSRDAFRDLEKSLDKLNIPRWKD